MSDLSKRVFTEISIRQREMLCAMWRLLNQPARMAQNLRPVFRSCRRRFPSSRYTSVEQFIRCRLMIPDGDRRHCTESRGIVNEPYAAGMTNDDIVGVFVLHDDVIDDLYGREAEAPTNDIFERFLGSKQCFDAVTHVVICSDAPFDATTFGDGATRHDGRA
jgi:hypothetical protein